METDTMPAVRYFSTAVGVTGANNRVKWSDLDFGFWNLDFGLKLLEVDTSPNSRSLNPKSEIQNLKYE
jgi:hypothetical protein